MTGINPLLRRGARLVIGHRGNPIAFAENTLESYQSALDAGADALEMDVRLSRDGVAMLVHDETLDRTTNATGRVDALTSEELDALDASARAPTRGKGQLRIPTLEQVLDRFRDASLVIEVKELKAADVTERLVRKFNAQGRVVVGSAETAVTERFYRSGLATIASMKDAMLLLPFALTGMTPPRPGFDVLSVPPVYRGIPIPVKRLAAAVANHGVPTHVWTVNDAVAAKEFWNAGVTGIVTDDPAAMVRARQG